MVRKINYAKVLRTLEHIVLIGILAASVGFYYGNAYGQTHVDLKSLKTTQNSQQVQSK